MSSHEIPSTNTPATIQSAQLQTCLRLCTALNAASLPQIQSCLSSSPHFTHRYLPRTLGAAAQEARNFDDTMAVFKDTFESVVQRMGIELPPKEVVQGTDKVVFVVEDRGVKRDGTGYEVEYVMIFGFEGGREEIGELLQFRVRRCFDGLSIAEFLLCACSC